MSLYLKREWFDIGEKEEYKEANKYYRNKK